MSAVQPATTAPPEAERLRDALHEVTFWSVSLLRDAETAKHLLDLGVEPKADEWPRETGDGDDRAAPSLTPENDLTDVDDYGWRRLLPILREDLRESWAAHDEAHAALLALPSRVAQMLDERGDRRWTVRVRSTLDALGRWHYGTRPRRTKLRAYPPDVSALIRLLRDSLPDWSGLLDSIQGFQTDLFALRGESPPELPGSASGSIPAACVELLKWLETQPDALAPLVELPEHLRDAHLLTFADSRGLIQFGQRNHCFAGGELQLENGWSFSSVTGPQRKPMTEALKEEAAANPEHPDLRIHVRLTHEGRIALAEHALAGGGQTAAPPRDQPQPVSSGTAASASGSPAGRAVPGVGEWNALTDRQRLSLQALHELRAFDVETRKTAERIAKKAEGPQANVDGFKAPLAQLTSLRYLASKRGGQGGSWLTDAGRRLVEAHMPEPRAT